MKPIIKQLESQKWMAELETRFRYNSDKVNSTNIMTRMKILHQQTDFLQPKLRENLVQVPYCLGNSAKIRLSRAKVTRKYWKRSAELKERGLPWIFEQQADPLVSGRDNRELQCLGAAELRQWIRTKTTVFQRYISTDSVDERIKPRLRQISDFFQSFKRGRTGGALLRGRLHLMALEVDNLMWVCPRYLKYKHHLDTFLIAPYFTSRMREIVQIFKKCDPRCGQDLGKSLGHLITEVEDHLRQENVDLAVDSVWNPNVK